MIWTISSEAPGVGSGVVPMNGSICASNGKDAGNPNAEITASVVCALSIPAVRAVEMALTNWRSLSDSPYIGALHHALEARGVDDALGIF